MTRFPVVGSLLFIAVACGTAPDAGSVSDVRVQVDTVNGVEWIRNFGTPPTWPIEEILRLGSEGTVGEPAPDEFGRVTSAIWGSDDRVYVADGMNDEVKVFNRDGSLALTIGRDGEGPGEFGGLYSLAWVGDTLLALDFGLGRIGMFDVEGNWLGQRNTLGRITGSPAQLRLYQTGIDEAYAFSFERTAGSLRRTFVRHTTKEASDTLWQVSAEQEPPSGIVCRSSNAMNFWDIPFAPKLLQHPAPNRLIAVMRTDKYQIAFLTNDGDTVRVVEREIALVPADADEWNEGLREYHEFRDENPGVPCEPGSLRMPDFQPPVRHFLLDPLGRTWVEVVAADGVYWEMFDASGVLVGRIPTFPVDERNVPYFAELHVVAVAADSLGVQRVAVYEFAKPGA